MKRIPQTCPVLIALTLLGCGQGNVDPTFQVQEISRPFEEITPPLLAEDDWPGWRGPSGNGTVTGPGPLHWSETQNVIWKVPVPGRGHSSPTVVGDSVYLATANDSTQAQSVIAYDRATGEPRWRTVLNRGGFPTGSQTHRTGTNANSTIACDGDRLFIAFLHHEAITAYALDLNGELIWEEPLGPFAARYGYAPSPHVHKSLVILSADHQGGGFLSGLHRETGETIWKKSRPQATSCSSAVVATFGNEDLLVIGGCEMLAAYHPTTGQELWTVAGLSGTTCGTCVWDDEQIYASGGYPDKQTLAVTRTGRQVWSNRTKCYESSMLLHEGHLYAVDDAGIGHCWEAVTGEEMWKQRLLGSYSASPIIAEDNIYVTSETGLTTIFAAEPKAFTPVAENQLGQEAFATPTICGGRMYHRVSHRGSNGRQEWLYCIGEGEGPR